MKNRTDVKSRRCFFVYQLSIIYLILNLIYWMFTIFIFDSNRQLVATKEMGHTDKNGSLLENWVTVTTSMGTLDLRGVSISAVVEPRPFRFLTPLPPYDPVTIPRHKCGLSLTN